MQGLCSCALVLLKTVSVCRYDVGRRSSSCSVLCQLLLPRWNVLVPAPSTSPWNWGRAVMAGDIEVGYHAAGTALSGAGTSSLRLVLVRSAPPDTASAPGNRKSGAGQLGTSVGTPVSCWRPRSQCNVQSQSSKIVVDRSKVLAGECTASVLASLATSPVAGARAWRGVEPLSHTPRRRRRGGGRPDPSHPKKKMRRASGAVFLLSLPPLPCPGSSSMSS